MMHYLILILDGVIYQTKRPKIFSLVFLLIQLLRCIEGLFVSCRRNLAWARHRSQSSSRSFLSVCWGWQAGRTCLGQVAIQTGLRLIRLVFLFRAKKHYEQTNLGKIKVVKTISPVCFLSF
jgi:hypothetical protein